MAGAWHETLAFVNTTQKMALAMPAKRTEGLQYLTQHIAETWSHTHPIYFLLIEDNIINAKKLD
jgi:hypothetical protein